MSKSASHFCAFIALTAAVGSAPAQTLSADMIFQLLRTDVNGTVGFSALPNVLYAHQDPVNASGNFVSITSPNNLFSQQIVGLQGYLWSTNRLPSLEAVRNEISAGPWSLTIYDAAVGSTNHYQFSVDASSLTDDFVRPLSVTSPPPFSVIGPTFTFGWELAEATNGLANYDFAAATMFPVMDFQDPVSMQLGTNARSWTLDGGLVNPGDYTFWLFYRNRSNAPNLLTFSAMTPSAGSLPLNGFTPQSEFLTSAEVSVSVVPEPQIGWLAMIGCFAVLLHRRGWCGTVRPSC